jgi:hypothetical protein
MSSLGHDEDAGLDSAPLPDVHGRAIAGRPSAESDIGDFIAVRRVKYDIIWTIPTEWEHFHVWTIM